jgi:hypothetical protein
VPRRTPKYAFARRTSESRIQTRLEKSSKTTFYVIKQQHSRTQEMHGSIKRSLLPIESIRYASVSLPHFFAM